MSGKNLNTFSEVLISRWKLDVLEKLSERSEYRFTIRELSEKTSGSYGSVREFVHALNDWGAVSMVKKGGSLLVSYNPENSYADLIDLLLETESDYLRKKAEQYVDKLVEDFPEVEKVILYGSVARREAGKNSDIDLLVVSEISEKKIWEHSHNYSEDVTISPVVESSEEFQKNIENSKEFEKEVKKEGVTLYS